MKTITFPRGPIFGADGKISPNGILLGYEPDTDNLKQWFYDAEHTTLAPNPIQAASDGRIPEVYLGEGKYRIKQYAPASEQSIIPDDMTDFPVGDDWTFICEWICEGENIVKGTKTLSVDYVRNLADVAASDAAWVQVMNYSRQGDCFPRWFYHTDVAHTPDGGSVFVARDGGYWVLAIDGQIVDARIFGVAEEEEDVFGNLAQALDYCYRTGKTLYLPAGTYSMTTSGTLHAECPIIFGDAHGDTVLFNTEDGASVVLSVENEYVIPQTTTMCYAADTDFHIDFSSCPVSGTCYALWNPKEGLAQYYDLSRFNGQSVVAWTGRYEGLFSVKTLVVKGAVGIFASAGSSIETLTKDGNGSARSLAQTVSVGVAYASALYTESGITEEGSFSIDTLVLDANVVFNQDRTFGKIVEAGGLIELQTEYMQPPPVLTVTTPNTLALTAFSTVNREALDAIARNCYGVVDLHNATVTFGVSTFTSNVKTVQNGTIASDSFVGFSNADLTMKNITAPAGSFTCSSGTLAAYDCNLACNIYLTAGTNFRSRKSVLTGTLTMSENNDASVVDHNVVCEGTEFLGAASAFASCNLTLKDCVFAKQFTIVHPQYTHITGCACTDDSASDNLAFKMSGINYTNFKCHIVGNSPNPELDTANSLHWPKSEGYIFHEVTQAELDNPAADSWNTKWGTLSEAVDASDPGVGISFDYAICQRVDHNPFNNAYENNGLVFASVPRTYVMNHSASLDFNFTMVPTLVAADILRVQFRQSVAI